MIENTSFASHPEGLACVAQESHREELRLVPSRTVGTVLIIDENEVLCNVVSIALRTQGFHVFEAYDGQAGVDLFQIHEAVIDVIVMDLTLPRLSGREALRQLVQIRRGVKVIVTSSFSRDSAWRALGGLHPWGFLQKPYLSSELIDLLQKACKPGSE
jgi:two-component system cell cycle sensor histidine kinase/response regulator CckA